MAETPATAATDETTNKSNVTKSKLRTIMEAASALTALGDEEAESKTTAQPEAKASAAKKPAAKRYIPEHKKPDAALTFPEKLMNLMRFAEEHDQDSFCVAWLPDGKSFVIRNPDEFTRQVLPKYFKATKFSSFTRKLYRWGFRQVNRGIGPDDPIIFGNEYFQRDNAEDMSKMRSVTAASAKKTETQVPIYMSKRPLDVATGGPDHKRALLDHLLQQKAASLMAPNAAAAGFYGGGLPGSAVSLTSALRPMGMGGAAAFGAGIPAMMSKHMEMMGQQASNKSNNNNSLMNNFAPQQSGATGQGPQQGYPHPSSTADIVNAAISALRYAS